MTADTVLPATPAQSPTAPRRRWRDRWRVHVGCAPATLRRHDLRRRLALVRRSWPGSDAPAGRLRASGVLARRALVQPVGARDPRRARVRALPGLPLLRRGRVAALLPAGAAAAHRHASARSSASATSIPHKRALFDIGVAGPLAGFVVAVPLLRRWACRCSRLVPVPADLERTRRSASRCSSRLAQQVLWGALPDGLTAAPAPDGASRRGSACWPRRSTCFRSASSTAATSPTRCSAASARWITLATAAAIAGARRSCSLSWIAWTVLMVVVLAVAGLSASADRRRRAAARPHAAWRWRVAAALVFVLCFTPGRSSRSNAGLGLGLGLEAGRPLTLPRRVA